MIGAPGLDEPLVAIKRVGDTKLAQARLSLVSDGMGQLVSIADSAGTYNNVYENPSTYASGTWATSGITQRAQTFDPRRLATDTTSAISSFRTRQYDPATGSWLQEDHAGLAGGTNLYEYNGNDPNSFRDPVGLQPDDCPDCAKHVIHPDPGEIRPVSAGNDPILVLVSGAVGLLTSAVGDAVEATDAAVSISRHQAVDNAERGISADMSKAAIRVGEKYMDAKHPGTIAHVIRGGMASGKDLYVVTDATSTNVVTSIKMTFIPETLFDGAPRWTPIP